MKLTITVNDKLVEIAHATSVEQLFCQLNIVSDSSAIAVNQQIVSRENWSEIVLCEGDDILLFQAVAGG